MPTFDQILSRVVERKGYAVQGADSAGLLARRGDESLLVAWKTDGAVSPSDALLFVTAMAQVQASAGILVAPRGTDQAARDQLAVHKNVELWAESRLVVEVGEAFVKVAMDAAASAGPAPAPTPAAAPTAAPAVHSSPSAMAVKQTSRFPSLVAQAVSLSQSDTRGAAYLMPSKPRAAPTAAAVDSAAPLRYAWAGISSADVDPGVAQVRSGRRPRQVEGAPSPIIVPEYDDVELVSTPRRAAPAPAAPVAAAAPVAETTPRPAPAPVAVTEEYEIISKPRREAAPAPAPVAEVAAPVAVPVSDALRVHVTRADAEVKASSRTGSPRGTKLTLIPHVAFEYATHVERAELPVPIEGRGVVLVSSLTGELRAVDRLDFADTLPEEARRDVVKLQAVDVYDRVKGHLTKQFTKEVKAEREVGGVTVMENQRVAPSLEELGLTHKGIVYVPFWEVTGSAGAARVDGLNGALL